MPGDPEVGCACGLASMFLLIYPLWVWYQDGCHTLIHHTHIIARKEDASVPTFQAKRPKLLLIGTLSCVYPWTNDCHRGNGMKVLIFWNDLLSLKLEVGQLPSAEQGLSGAGENICCEGRTSKWGWVQIKHTGKVFQEMWKPSMEEKWLCVWELMGFLFCISSQALLTCRL